MQSESIHGENWWRSEWWSETVEWWSGGVVELIFETLQAPVDGTN